MTIEPDAAREWWHHDASLLSEGLCLRCPGSRLERNPGGYSARCPRCRHSFRLGPPEPGDQLTSDGGLVITEWAPTELAEGPP